MVQVGWMWMPTFQRNGTCGPFNRRRPTHPTTLTSAGLFSINFKRIRIAWFNIALYKISRSNLVICEMFLSLKQYLLVFQIDLRSHNSSWGLISDCRTSFDFLLSPFLFFFSCTISLILVVTVRVLNFPQSLFVPDCFSTNLHSESESVICTIGGSWYCCLHDIPPNMEYLWMIPVIDAQKRRVTSAVSMLELGEGREKSQAILTGRCFSREYRFILFYCL